MEAFDSNYIAPAGPHLDAFEKSFLEKTGFKHCVAVSSGTAAMHLALRHLEVSPGDVVIASSLTFIGSVSPILFQGATPLFVDSDPETWNMDTSLLAEALERCRKEGRRVAAVVPTDLYGQSCDQEKIRTLCDSHATPFVVDSAESLGATYRGASTGRTADAAVFSFNGNKILTTSGGGILASDEREMIDQARHLATQAREPVAHFEHRELGYNYRLSNLCAAVGWAQLQSLEDRVVRKREIFQIYEEELGDLPGISLMPQSPKGESNCWLTVILIDPAEFGASREEVRLALEEENIESRPMWKPMHAQPVFEKCEYLGRGIADELFEKGLCLPSGTAMNGVDLARITAIIIGQCRSR